MDITFITPKAGFVVKTSSDGNIKTFINICSNENIGLPSSTAHLNGLNWQVPYILAPPRLDYDKKHEKCNVYDVVFHPDSIGEFGLVAPVTGSKGGFGFKSQQKHVIVWNSGLLDWNTLNVF